MIKKHLSILFVVLFFILGFISCNKDDDSLIGMNIIPGGDRISLFCDTLSVNFYTVKEDNVEVTDKSLSPLGSYIDPVFGFSKASFATQFKLPVSNVDFSKVENVNSLILNLRLHSVYGDSITSQTVNVYRLNKDLDPAETYTSDFKFQPGEYQLLTTTTLKLDPSDTTRTVKLELPRELANEFVKSENKDHFKNDSTFKAFFKGLYFETVDVANGGGVFSFGLTDTKTKMIMKYNDSLEFNFLIDSKLALIKMFEQDYTLASTELINAINDNTLHNYFYVQGLGGVKTKLSFPELETLFDSTNIAINRARLVVNLKQNTGEDEFAPPVRLTLMKKDSDGNFGFVDDQRLSIKIFDGTYNTTTYSYTFNLTLHIQDLVKGDKDSEIYLVPLPARDFATPHRAVFYGNIDELKSPKLELYYSEY